MRTFSRLFVLAAIVASIAPVSASADDLVYIMQPRYAEAFSDHWSSPGLIGTASAQSRAMRAGSITLSGDTSDAGLSGSSAAALGWVYGDPIPWGSEGIRIETTMDFSFLHTETSTAQALGSTASQNVASLQTWVLGTVSQNESLSWRPETTSNANVTVGGQLRSSSSGTVAVSASYRSPCAGAGLITPVAFADINLSGAALRVGQATLDLEAQVKEIRLYRDSTVACFDLNVISVLDNEFSPPAVTMSPGDAVQFDFDATDIEHDIWIETNEYWSQIDPEFDQALVFNQPGQYPYWCEIHGTSEGEGMSGLVTVTT